MKITSVSVYLVKSGMLHPVIVRIDTDEAVSGVGEAGIAYGLGGTAAAGMIKDLAERLLMGRDPGRIEQIWSEMYDHSFWAKGGGAIMFAAISAIEQALWDIKGKALGVPVYDLLGGRIHDDLAVYANGWCFGTDTAAKMAKAGEKPVRDGYKAIKCYPLAQSDPLGTLRHVTRRTVEREFANLAFDKIKALRDAVGPDIDIMIDLSGALTTDETIRLCRRFDELDLLFIEEPADPFDIGALSAVAERLTTPVAVGERLYTRHGFRKVLEAQAVGILQPDVGTAGGILECKKIAAMAEAWNMRVAPHNCATSVTTSASLQLAACIPNFMIQEIYPYFCEAPGYVEIVRDPPEHRIKDSRITLSEAPGIGVELDDRAIAPFLLHQCEA
jgi:galactonate dehydratase